MSNKKYTKEFKEESKRLIRESGESVSNISKRIGVSKNTLYKWNKTKDRVNGEGDKEGLIKENKRLMAALRLAEEERDILKKAAAYFAKVSR